MNRYRIQRHIMHTGGRTANVWCVQDSLNSFRTVAKCEYGPDAEEVCAALNARAEAGPTTLLEDQLAASIEAVRVRKASKP